MIRNKKIIGSKTKSKAIITPVYTINTDGFRKDLDDYFEKYMYTYKKQTSPFIVVDGSNIHIATHTSDLFSLPLTATIFHTWPGKYRSDVFVYDVKEFMDWLNSSDVNKDKYKE